MVNIGLDIVSGTNSINSIGGANGIHDLNDSNGTTKKSSTLDFTTFYNIIDGKRETTAKTRHAVNPSTLEANPEVPVSSQADLDRAVAAARKASVAWAKTPVSKRQEAVRRFADAIEREAEAFAVMLTKEQGKPLDGARAELNDTPGFLRFAAQQSMEEEMLEDSHMRRVSVRYTPLGVAAGIVPWNFPVLLACAKIGPALVAGNAFILKPSPFAPYCNLKLAELGMRFFPPGVFQALSGDDSLGPLVTEHPGIDKISFTGSSATGKRVMASCSKTLKRLTLELGGNDPAIVCKDVDVKAIAPQITTLALYNSGQICIAIKRVYIHEDVYDEMLAAMAEFVKTMKVADGLSEGTVLGPLQNKLQFDRVRDLLDDIADKKLDLAAGSTSLHPQAQASGGYFVTPTIVANPPDDARIVREEPFGPVFPVLKWRDEDDVVARANNTDMGLGASVWTRDAAQGERLANQLKAGTVWVNAHMALDPSFPFGGLKHSGVGVEFGLAGFKSYCNARTVHIHKL